METAREAADPVMVGPDAAAADPLPFSSSPPPPPPAPAPEAAQTVPPPPPLPNAGVQPLVYYAVWLPGPAGAPAGAPIYLPAGGASGGMFPPMTGGAPPMMAAASTPLTSGAMPSPSEAQMHNQRLLVWAIILCVLAVHLPWIAYLVAVHGCWGTFIDVCWHAPMTEGVLEGDVDPFAETVGEPFLFARIVFLMLRVQAVLSADWGEYSQAMQLSTGLGSFVLTRIVASNGLVFEARGKAIYLAALCLTLFFILFWAELHLTSDEGQPLLGDDTVLDYISQTLPPDFASYGSVREGLMQLLQFLRLADALILGACLALPTTQRKTA